MHGIHQWSRPVHHRYITRYVLYPQAQFITDVHNVNSLCFLTNLVDYGALVVNELQLYFSRSLLVDYCTCTLPFTTRNCLQSDVHIHCPYICSEQPSGTDGCSPFLTISIMILLGSSANGASPREAISHIVMPNRQLIG